MELKKALNRRPTPAESEEDLMELQLKFQKLSQMDPLIKVIRIIR